MVIKARRELHARKGSDGTGGAKRLLMFDVGGVLLKYSESAHFSSIAHNIGADPKLLIPVATGLTQRMETGSLTLKEGEAALAKRFGARAAEVRWMDEFLNNSKPDERVVGLVGELYADHRMAITTNTVIAEYVRMFGSGGILRELRYHYMFASCYMGVRKPEAAFFLRVLGKTGTDADSALFIDDREANTSAAERLGIRSIRFGGYGSLAKEISEYI